MEIFNKLERIIAIALLGLLTIVVAAAAVEVGYEVLKGMITPPGFFLDVSELLGIFGVFLVVLIGLELMSSIHMYLKDHKIHAEMMFLIAMTAVTRKIVILDTTKLDPLTVFGLGFLIIALALGYNLIKRRRSLLPTD